MSNLNRNEIIIDGIKLNTTIEAERRILGSFSETLLLKLLINNGINVKYMNENTKFNQYDFLIRGKDGTKYILELKSRLSHISNHTIEIIDYKKISYYKHLKNIIPIFIFLHYEDEDKFKFYYYIIDDYEKLKQDCFFNDKFNYYELPTRLVKDINELLEII